MRTSRLRQLVSVGVVAAAAAAMLLSSSPAGATTISHPNDVIAAGGSDTTEALMAAVLSTGNKEYNVPTINAGKMHVPSDTHCVNTGTKLDPQGDQGISYSSDPTIAATGFVGLGDNTNVQIAPNGSGDGRRAVYDAELNQLFKGFTTFGTGGTALVTTGTPRDNGCFDVGRSSDDPRAQQVGESANSEYYAFALDAVTAASTSREAPSALSIQQIRDIFNCTITDWSQIPGNAGRGPIQRFFPSVSSGTGQTFIKKILGGDDPTTHTTGSCPAVKTIEENRGDRFTLSTSDPASYSQYLDQAIMPFSAGKWDYFANNYFNPTIDIRGGVRLLGQVPSGAVVGTDPAVYPVLWQGTAGKFRIDGTDALHVSESNPNLFTPTDTGTAGNKHLSGVRYLYNVIIPNTGSYTVARQIVGFDPAANPSATAGGICAGTFTTTIVDQGFLQLQNATDSGSATQVRCRKDPVAHPLTTTITSSPSSGPLSLAGSHTIVYTITFSSTLNADLVIGQLTQTNTGTCDAALTTVTTKKVYSLSCTPSAVGSTSISVPAGSVTANIGAYPTVPNNAGSSSVIVITA